MPNSCRRWPTVNDDDPGDARGRDDQREPREGGEEDRRQPRHVEGARLHLFERAEPVDRLLGADRVHGVAHGARQRERLGARAHEARRPEPGILAQREIDLVDRRVGDAVLADVSRDADDRQPDDLARECCPATPRRLPIGSSPGKTWLAIVLLMTATLRRLVPVGLGDPAAPQDRNSDRLEVVLGHALEVGAGLRLGRRGLTAFDPELPVRRARARSAESRPASATETTPGSAASRARTRSWKSSCFSRSR